MEDLLPAAIEIYATFLAANASDVSNAGPSSVTKCSLELLLGVVDPADAALARSTQSRTDPYDMFTPFAVTALA
jgi:hypothetical protein